VGVFDRSDNLVRFDSGHELVSEETDDAVAEAVAASTMSSEWLDGDGRATDPKVILRAKALLESILDSGAPQPRVVPVPDGGLQAEWTIGDREISVAVVLFGVRDAAHVDHPPNGRGPHAGARGARDPRAYWQPHIE
jgi:hypothetical protein